MEKREYRILCVDDTIDAEEFDRRFREDGTRGEGDSGDGRRLVRQGPVCESRGQATSALLRALNHGPAPDAILIDDYLRAGEAGHLRREGLVLMLEITKECAQRQIQRPVCVLWTQGEGERNPPSPDPCLCYAFRELGGHHVVDKRLGWPERLSIVWRALLEDERWEPWPVPPRPQLTDLLRALLPYLEADKTVNETARELGRDDQRVREQRNELVNRIREQLGIELSGHGRTIGLAAACKDGGHVWVPLALVPMVEEARACLG